MSMCEYFLVENDSIVVDKLCLDSDVYRTPREEAERRWFDQLVEGKEIFTKLDVSKEIAKLRKFTVD